MKARLIALAIAAAAVLAPLSLTSVPVASAAPCRVIAAPGCTPVPPGQSIDNPHEPRGVDQGKKGPRSAGNPSRR